MLKNYEKDNRFHIILGDSISNMVFFNWNSSQINPVWNMPGIVSLAGFNKLILMYLRLYFTDKEMMNYLIKRGYEIFVFDNEIEIPIHGSMFFTSTQKTIEVERDGVRENLKNAFEKEIKQFLISN